MKQILIELDDRCARDLEKVAPVKKRLRAEFVRRAIRRAIDLALDRTTQAAYEKNPISSGVERSDLEGWDMDNRLAQTLNAGRSRRPRRGSRSSRRSSRNAA